jgi:hypothetical protein
MDNVSNVDCGDSRVILSCVKVAQEDSPTSAAIDNRRIQADLYTSEFASRGTKNLLTHESVLVLGGHKSAIGPSTENWQSPPHNLVE